MKIILVFLIFVNFNIYSEIIGETKVELKGENSGKEETILGNFITDAVRDSAKVSYSTISAGTLGEGMGIGNIDEKDISFLTPYIDDEIVIIELNGKQVKEMLEKSIRLYPKENNSFLQISGMSVVVDKNKKPGERIIEVKMGEENLDENKKYQIATNSFLALGGVGYYKIFNEKNIIKETKIKLKEAILKFIKDKKIIDYKIEGRIKVKEEEKEESK